MNDNEALGTGPKRDPRTLELRGRPERVTRFRRAVVVALAGLGAAVIFALTWWALDPLTIAPFRVGEDLLQEGAGAGAERLHALPDSYDDIAPPPELGPPLPGDLGPPLLAKERALGLEPDGGFDADSEAARAERLRLAQQARQAREAGVFFLLALRRDQAPAGLEGEAEPLESGIMPGLDRPTESGLYNPHALLAPMSPYQVMAGTIIPASLITGLNSDLPGPVLAQVTEHVYDTATGMFVLIPQGTRIIGSYDSVIDYGQSRARVVWNRLIFPNGRSLAIENLPATDIEGHAGLADAVDHHTGSLIRGIVLSTLLDIGGQLTLGSEETGLLSALGRSTRSSLESAGELIVRQELSVQPSITVRPGWALKIIVHNDLLLEPYDG